MGGSVEHPWARTQATPLAGSLITGSRGVIGRDGSVSSMTPNSQSDRSDWPVPLPGCGSAINHGASKAKQRKLSESQILVVQMRRKLEQTKERAVTRRCGNGAKGRLKTPALVSGALPPPPHSSHSFIFLTVAWKKKKKTKCVRPFGNDKTVCVLGGPGGVCGCVCVWRRWGGVALRIYSPR